MAFSIASAGAAAHGYQRGIDLRLDRDRLAGIEGRAQERHGITMDDAEYRQQSRLPADTVRDRALGDISWTDETREHTRGERQYGINARLPADEVQQQHRAAEERRRAAESRAQAQAGRAASDHAYNLAARVSPDKARRAQELSLELAELDAAAKKEFHPLAQAGKKAEAVQAIMASRGQTYETLAAAYFELGPEAVVDALNQWGGTKVDTVDDFRKIQTENGTEYAAVDAQGNTITDPTTNQPMRLSEKQMQGYYARYQARHAAKGKRNVKEVRDDSGNSMLVDVDTGQTIGNLGMDEAGNPVWTPAGKGDAAPPPRPPGAPRPAIGEGPQPPQAHLDKLREGMMSGDPALRKHYQEKFDQHYGQGAAMHWMGEIQKEQRAKAEREQQESTSRREAERAVQQTRDLLRAVHGGGIAPRGPTDPPTEADAELVRVFEANRDALERGDRGLYLEAVSAYQHAKQRLSRAPQPRGIDAASEARDDWLGGIDAPLPGAITYPYPRAETPPVRDR